MARAPLALAVVQRRWPSAALALAPVTLRATAHNRRFAPLAALLVHQIEEWVWPGGFLARMNREVLGSTEPASPLTPAIAFRVNVLLGWSASLAPLGPPAATPASAALYANHLGNSALHVIWMARERRYNPGVVTAAVLLAPISGLGLRQTLASARRRDRVGAAVGAVAAAALVPAMRRRARALGQASAGATAA